MPRPRHDPTPRETAAGEPARLSPRGDMPQPTTAAPVSAAAPVASADPAASVSAAHALWQTLAAAGGRTLRDTQLQQLELFLELLARANTTMNLTRLVDLPRARLLHVADSLTLLPHTPADARRLADVGSGGGVPGLVLAVALPDVQVELIESTGKKAAFLRAAAAELGLSNVTVHADRAEAVARTDRREQFDTVTARAVAALPLLLEWCLPLARVGGRVLAMKGPKLAEELPDARKVVRRLGGGDITVHPVTAVPGADGHVICCISKVAPTPAPYPRSPQQARRRPLSEG